MVVFKVVGGHSFTLTYMSYYHPQYSSQFSQYPELKEVLQ
ncbi:Uncharacterised protein [Cytobacillus firmus]|nr:Uncharacterised protein [Cytobacillus firmus]